MVRLHPVRTDGGILRQTATPFTAHYCVPNPRYGASGLGGRCSVDEDCDARAPYCVGGACASWCPPTDDGAAAAKDCPSGYECLSVQRWLKDDLQSSDFCVRRRNDSP